MTATQQGVAAASTIDDIRRLFKDRFTIEQELGRGGMGAVYLARDISLDRPIALKVLPPEYAMDLALRERFLRETRTAASFSHPNIVPVHSVEEREGVLAYAMGFVEGESLAQRVANAGVLSTRELVRLLQDVGYALAYAHGRSVVHRDIKPDNIMIERATGRALLMDFGISRSITAAVAAVGLTRVGEVVGTPEYMSPEQSSGDVVDGRSDLYSLGLVAWFAATGETAITGETTQKILVRQLTEAVPPIATRRPDVPPALAGAIDRCTAKDPNDRFATAESLVDTIDAAQLATPDVPLPIRLFSNELDTVSIMTFFAFILIWMLGTRALARGWDNLDSLLPVVLMGSIVFGRYLQTLAEARRLAVMGFKPPEVIEGLRRILGERTDMRAQLRADPETRRRRSNTIRTSVTMVAGSIALLYFGRATRVPTGPGVYGVPPHGFVMLISGFIMLGIGLVLLFKSPLRAPPTERVFRRIWLGPVGLALLQLAERKARGSTSTLSRTGGSPVAATARAAITLPRSLPSPAPSSAAAPPQPTPAASAQHATPRLDAKAGPSAVLPNADSIASLEQRVRALEQWRDESRNAR